MTEVKQIIDAVNKEETEIEAKAEEITLADFLMNTPPLTEKIIKYFLEYEHYHNRNTFNLPKLTLPCPSNTCKNENRIFKPRREDPTIHNSPMDVYLPYICSNCDEAYKTYSLKIIADTDKETTVCTKYGELPAFGPPTPALLIKMLGKDKDIFLKGRRCESQGLGIAAFAYYRRVVEHQKNRIFDQIIKVTKMLEPESALIDELTKAKEETQFTKSFDHIKAALPQTLYISGHHPLQLLHSALSEGLHNDSDEDCLEYAAAVRVVLATLADKLKQALNDNKEVSEAVKKLAAKKSKKKS